MLKIIAAIACVTTAIASVGPSSLYTLLNGQTFNPPGYTVVAYQSCVQNQNAGNNCGSFTRYETSNGQYTYQLYGPAACSGSCCREFHLTLACGATMVMSGVNENPICTYSATLYLPEVCGVDMTVGNEAASVSPSALPPTSTATQTATETATATETSTASATSTPLFFTTPFPSTTSTMTLSATSTPLYMMTAYPSSSPVNVSATSTPLFMYTAYPSVGSNATGPDLAAIVAGLVPAGSPLATILGSVAVGIVGLGALAYTIHHFRKGGSVKDLVSKAKSQKDAIAQAASMLPISDEQKTKLNAAIDNPESLLPPEAQQAIAIAQNVNLYKQQAIASLPISDAQKETLSNTIQGLQTQVQQRIEQSPVGIQLTSLVGSLAQPPPDVVETPPPVSNSVAMTISAEDLADVQALLQAKQQAKQ
jgi:hypothetical protein